MVGKQAHDALQARIGGRNFRGFVGGGYIGIIGDERPTVKIFPKVFPPPFKAESPIRSRLREGYCLFTAKIQGLGRRCMGRGLLLIAVLMCTVLAFAKDPPDAPSATRAAVLHTEPELSTVPVANFDIKEWTSALVAVRPEQKRVVDKKFLVLTGIATGVTVADFELTQNCIARHACVESDPLMPSSRAGMYASSAPVNAAMFYWSYRLKAHGNKLWWLPTAAVIASHAIGVGTNMRFLK
jgi:hypothetical protein